MSKSIDKFIDTEIQVDWRAILKKYMNRVGEEEGVWFLYENDYTSEEWLEIVKIQDELIVENKNA